MMFTVSESLEGREKKILDFTRQDAVIGVLLSAIHFEWCLVRCFLMMGTTSSKEMLKTRVSKKDKHFTLEECSGLESYKKAWDAEIEPQIHIIFEDVFATLTRPDVLIPNRGTATIKKRHECPEVTTGLSCLRYAMNCRNEFVHGVKGTTSSDHAQALIEIFFSAARALNDVALRNGVNLFSRRRTREDQSNPNAKRQSDSTGNA